MEQGDRARLDKARDVYLDSTWCSLQQGGARIDHHLNTIPPFHHVKCKLVPPSVNERGMETMRLGLRVGGHDLRRCVDAKRCLKGGLRFKLRGLFTVRVKEIFV